MSQSNSDSSSFVLIAQLEDLLELQTQKTDAKRKEIANCFEEIAELKQEITLLKQELSSETEQRDELITKLRNEIREFRDRQKKSFLALEENNRLTQQVETLLSETRKMSDMLQDNRNQLQMYKDENHVLHLKLEKKKDSFNRSFEHVKSQVKQNKEDLEAMRRQNEVIQKEYDTLQDRYLLLEGSYQRMADRNEVIILQKDNEITSLKQRLKQSKEAFKKTVDSLTTQQTGKSLSSSKTRRKT